MEPEPIFRAPMRARHLDLPAGAGAEFGVENGLVGIGEGPTEKDGRMVARFVDLPEGTLVWTRLTEGSYRLGRITGPWRRDDSPAALAVGIVNVRPTDWLDHCFEPGEVPAAVAVIFARGGRNFQRTHDRAAEQATADLWQRYQG